MALSTNKKLVLASSVPALLSTLLVILLAVNDMHAQRDQLLQALPQLYQADGVSLNQAKSFIEQQWDATFAAQAQLAIPGLIVIAVLLVMAALYLVRTITADLSRIVKGVEQMSDQATPVSYRIALNDLSDMKPLALKLNGMMERVDAMVSAVKGLSDNLDQSAVVLSDNAQQNNRSIEHLYQNIDSISVAMNELLSASSEIAGNVQHAHQEVETVNNNGQNIALRISELDQGFEQLNHITANTTRDVGELGNQVEGIYGILQTIQGIAEQTNLLALNAAIEAARAGEQGRGFAVVADEVRNLAGKTQQSTEEIQDMIENLKQSAERSMSAMEQSNQASDDLSQSFTQVNQQITDLFQRLKQVNEMNTQIATASEEQSQVISEINSNTVYAKDLTDSSQQASLSTGKQAEALLESAQQLRQLVAGFNTSY